MNIIRRISNIVSTLMIIALLTLTILLVGVRLVGLTPYAVLSGSMEPTYHVGSLIYVKEIAPEDITVGTPITFVVNKDLLVATHRVIEIECRTSQFQQMKDEEGNFLFESDGDPMIEEVTLDEPAYYYTTKGDANDVVDGSPVYYKNLIGTPVFSVPYLGYLSNWLQTRKGMIVALSSVMILMILTFLPDLLRMVDDEPQKKQPAKKKIPGKKRKKRPAEKQPEGERKRGSLTPEERASIIARRKERGEELRGPLTQEERALIIAGRREARAAAQAAASQSEAAEASAPQGEGAPSIEQAQTEAPAADEGEAPRRRRRRTPTE